MKPPDYRIRISVDSVSVQHRVKTPSWEVWLLIPMYALIIYFNHGFRVLADLARSGEWGAFCLMLLFLCAFIALFSWSWLLYSSGEFMHCDVNELQIGRRRVWTSWRRKSLSKQSVSKLSYGWRGGSKTRNYSVLTFQAAGKQIDVLEDISRDDAFRVLEVCRSFSFDCVLPEIFPNHDGPMNADIAKRGWLVNPWRPTHIESHPKDQ